MKPAYGDRVFVADFSAERPRLGEANVMRFGGHPAADGAGLGGDEFAMFLVAQANRLRRDATRSWTSGCGNDNRIGVCVVSWGEEGFLGRRIACFCWARL